MKRFFLFAFLLFFIMQGLSIAQQGYIDVVYLKNGGVVKGVIIEQIPNESIKIETSNGSIMIFQMSEISKMVKEKVNAAQENPPAPPPPVQNNMNVNQNPQTSESSFKFEGTYGSFMGGTHSVKPLKTETKVNGDPAPEIKYDSYSGFIFKAQVVFHGSENYALLIGGTVDKYANGTFTSYYIGGHLYFNKSNITPFVFAKAGYGFGSLENPYDKDEKISFTGPYLTGGAGAKVYLGKTWGLMGEAGYKYQGTSAEWDLNGSDGRTYNIETSQNIAGFEFAVGFFFYP